MPVEDPGDLLHMGARSLGFVHFEERFKDWESLDSGLPLLFMHGHKVGCKSSAPAGCMVWPGFTNGDCVWGGTFQPPGQ